MALARRAGSGKVLVMIPSAAGFIMEPPAPWMTRKAIRQPRLGARLHSQEPRMNSDRPACSTGRRPYRSARNPEDISRLASVTV